MDTVRGKDYHTLPPEAFGEPGILQEYSSNMPPGAIRLPLSSRVWHVFYGWRVVAAAFLVNAIADGTYFLGFSVFFLPISRDLQLSRATTSLPFALSRVVGGLMGPLVGMSVDRLGPGKVLVVAALLAGLGFVLLRWVDSFVLFLIVFLGLIAVGIQGGFGAASSAAVNRWFIRRRGVAVSFAQAGYGAGGAAIPPLLALGVTELGWRLTAMLAGLAIWLMVLPLSAQIGRSPEGVGLEPDGAPLPVPPSTEPSALSSPRTPSQDMPLGRALRTPTYWLMAVSFGFRSMVWGAIGVHIVAIMVWKGIRETQAGFLIGIFSLAWVPAILIMGWLGDRWSKPKVAAAGSMIATLAVALLLVWDRVSVWQMALVLVMLSPNEGAWSLGWAMLGDFFGRRNFATLRGGMLAVQSAMAVGTPLYSGWIYDATQSYFLVIAPASALMFVAGAMLWLLPRPR